MPEKLRYFALVDHHDVRDGIPQELAHFACAYAQPTMRNGRIVPVARPGEVEQADTIPEGAPGRILPGTRIVEISDLVFADVVARHPLFREIDPPTAKQLKAVRDATTAARAAAAAAIENEED